MNTVLGIEISMLLWAITLGFVHIVLGVMASTKERGLSWNLGPRDETPKPLGKMGGRLERASKNFLETFPFFLAAIVIVIATGRMNHWSALGAQIYVWARLVYLPLYFVGVPVARTLAWAASIVGIGMVIAAGCGGL